MKKRKETSKRKIITLSIMGAITLAIIVLAQYIFGETSVFNQAISANDFLNTIFNKIPAFLKSIAIVTISWLLSILICGLLKKLLYKNEHSITVVKLAVSFIKYTISIVAVMLILNAWGVDTATLLASAGILSLVIGLGAQSLISDIIAGIFLVFERELQVGDWVIIDGWRGTVDEIGIRTTKIIDWQGNIKIINNSAISSIINQSKEMSTVACVVSVDYREPIPKVEEIIMENLERIKNAIPEITEGPYYKGVDSLSSSSVDLLFVAKTKEQNYYVVQRALLREIKMIFDENNISIPFPQVTVNNPEILKKTVDNNDKVVADNFALDQKMHTKDMDDKNNRRYLNKK